MAVDTRNVPRPTPSTATAHQSCTAADALGVRSEPGPVWDAAVMSGTAALFSVLANDTRLRLLHALARAGEVRVTDLAAQIGMRTQGVSNQLQRLVDLRIVATRRDGKSIYYRIIDPCVPQMLLFALCLLEESPMSAELS